MSPIKILCKRILWSKTIFLTHCAFGCASFSATRILPWGLQKLEAIIKLTIYPNVFDYSTPIVSTITEKRASYTSATVRFFGAPQGGH